MTEKYLVAASICYTDVNKRNINLRCTTQMPNIRGFGPLMALIFSPVMHVKCNREKTHYTHLRTGLGYNTTKNQPIFAEHDMIFNLNVEITQHDIELVCIPAEFFVLFRLIWIESLLLLSFVTTGESNPILPRYVAVDLPRTNGSQ